MHAYVLRNLSSPVCLYWGTDNHFSICQMTMITILFFIFYETYSVVRPNCKHTIWACLLDMRHIYINWRKNSGGWVDRFMCCNYKQWWKHLSLSYLKHIFSLRLTWKLIHAKDKWYLIKLGLYLKFYFFNARLFEITFTLKEYIYFYCNR